LAVMVVAVGAAPNAHADSFTYVLTSNAFPDGSAEFTESSILTSVATITSFTSNTFSPNVVSLIIAPESGELCGGSPGPCIMSIFSIPGGTGFQNYYFSSNLTSTGTYDTTPGTHLGTLEI